MIDATDIIQHERTDEQLEELMLFLVAVAGKNADTTSRLLSNFFYTADFKRVSPFQQIRDMDTVSGMLLERLKTSRLGCYTKLEKAYRQLANSKIDFRTCTLEELMTIHGVGRKSASCFVAWTRKGEQLAMLDTHLLKFLRSQQEYFVSDNRMKGGLWDEIHDKIKDVKIPKTTPSSAKLYNLLEEIYLDICKVYKKNPTEFDLEIWRMYSGQ